MHTSDRPEDIRSNMAAAKKRFLKSKAPPVQETDNQHSPTRGEGQSVTRPRRHYKRNPSPSPDAAPPETPVDA